MLWLLISEEAGFREDVLWQLSINDETDCGFITEWIILVIKNHRLGPTVFDVGGKKNRKQAFHLRSSQVKRSAVSGIRSTLELPGERRVN